MIWSCLQPAEAPWGDYGNILVSGFTERRADDGRLPLLRVGPFVPPITVSGISDVIVTDAFRDRLANSGLKGLRFAEVWKKCVVKLDWRSWDLGADEPLRYPAGSEPENYILGRKHDQATADALGSLWEVVLDGTLDDPGHADIIRSAPSPFSSVLVSDGARAWLEDHSEGWLRFEEHVP